jgi:phosphate starvation-inducible PhoH-like protein
MNISTLFILFSNILFSNISITFSYKNIIHKNLNFNLNMKKSKSIKGLLYIPKTENQARYVDYLNDYNSKIVISIGPAGCGKTLFACQKAVNELTNNNINKIIITRPVVCVDEEIGFLPGNIVKKMDPWTRPIFDLFLEHYSRSELDLMLNNGIIEICPLAFMRGRTFKNAFIIADEMQNSSPNQMKMLTTRLGDRSRLVITGDLYQSDILKENGLNDFVNKFIKWNETNDSDNLIKFIQLNNSDIERSEIVKTVIDIYENNIIQNNTIIIGRNNIMETNNTPKKIKFNNDAALIPIRHLSNNYYHVFLDEKYFN